MGNLSRNKKITFGVIITFIGLLIIASPYFNLKRVEVFEDMNNQYYEYVMALNVNLEEIVDEEITSSTTTTKTDSNTIKKPETTTVNMNDYFIANIEISKIDLKRGFTSIDSKYNNVNRNIYVVPGSTFPDVSNNNLMLAAHSGNGYISFFKNLYKLSISDEVIINYQNKVYKYKIKNIYTDTKDGTVVIKRNKTKSTLTLITCTKGDSKTQTIYIAELI